VDGGMAFYLAFEGDGGESISSATIEYEKGKIESGFPNRLKTVSATGFWLKEENVPVG
jgi:hypothetical protein